MKLKLIEILAAAIAGMIVMILHEFPKALLYNKFNPNQDSQRKRNVYKLHHYVDPIGLVLCITNLAGFSKPYMYRIKDRKTNKCLGICGFVSLLLIFLLSISVLRYGIGMAADLTIPQGIGNLELIYQFVMVYMAVISLSMFIVNLFPISTFDMGLCIAGNSPSKYFQIIRNDYFIKIMLILIIIFQVITRFSTLILTLLL